MNKRILALVLAVVMTLALSVSALATDQGTNTNSGSGTITVNGDTLEAGRIYDIYRIFDLVGSDTSSPADGSYDIVSYTINENWVNFFIGTDAKGAAYLIEKTAENAETNKSLNTLNYNGITYFINITNDNIATFSNLALTYAVSLTNNDGTHKVTADEVTAEAFKFESIALGYYLVYPQGATEITSENSCICSLTSTTPSVTITPKATYPTIEKTDDKGSVDVGDTVTYTITGTVPDTTGYTKYVYQVSDTMTSGLTINKDVAVTINGTAVTIKTVTTTPANNAEIQYNDSGFVLYFDMTKYQENVGKTITITYTAGVNSAAVVAKTTNSAVLTYSNNPNIDPDTATGDDKGTTTTPPDIENVWTNKIVINKVNNATTPAKLSGAEFALMNGDGKFYNITEGDVSRVEVSGVTIDKNDGASVSTAAITALTDATNITKVTTDADGAASFEGLADGTYYLVELTAPTGYNLLDSTKAVTVEGTEDTDGIEVGVSATATVVNNQGSILPSTGGMGTTIFYIVGGVLVLGAVVLLVTKRRMAEKN